MGLEQLGYETVQGQFLLHPSGNWLNDESLLFKAMEKENRQAHSPAAGASRGNPHRAL